MTLFHDSFNRDENEICSRKKKLIFFTFMLVYDRFAISFIFLSFIFQFMKWKQRFNGNYFLFYERFDVKEFYMNDAFLNNSREAK